MVDAARRYARVVSGGSQRVLDDYGKLARQCWSGELGADQGDFRQRGRAVEVCNLPEEPVPEGLDWDMWLGPAPWRRTTPTESAAPTTSTARVGGRGATIPGAA